jgi:hypothetical protein
MNEGIRGTNVWLWLIIPIAALLAVASGGELSPAGFALTPLIL